MGVLTAIDILAIQRFIFSTNRLRDAIAASRIVDWALGEEGGLRNYSGNVLFAESGTALMTFDSMPQARAFTADYSRLLYEEAPGLEVVVAHREHSEGSLAAAMRALQVDIARTKMERTPSAPLIGLGVTASCRCTGLPASGFDKADTTAPLSRQVLRYREEFIKTRSYWDYLLEDLDEKEGLGFGFPVDLDKIGRTKHKLSLIAVVHVDGNGIGDKVAQWSNECDKNTKPDDRVRDEFVEFSRQISDTNKAAFRAVVNLAHESVSVSRDNGDPEARVEGRCKHLDFDVIVEGNKCLLPVRPVLLGGDDMTFVCDGRIAFDLATEALEVFKRATIDHLPGKKITASAGIALVRSHSPFSRAYELAEELCRSAKGMLREKSLADEFAIDWHVGMTRPGETVESIRRRQYDGDRLTFRPYRLGNAANDTGSWSWFADAVLGDDENGFRNTATWGAHRNKVKALREIAREGPDAIENAVKAWQIVDNNIVLPGGLPADGFDRGRTPLVDAVELVDLYLPIHDCQK